jgi:polysaccharide deacetylase family protein (PEP-CTERM system associated)
MTRTELELDMRSSKAMLEDICGQKVEGYRAAGFALPRDTGAFFELLAECGYRYDSSIFPARHRHGGQPDAELAPRTVVTPSGPVEEFPISVWPVLGWRLCLFGGGYFRAAPFALVRRGAHSVLNSGRPLVLYLHPREIDPEQPRLPLGFTRSLRTYMNLHRTEAKLGQLLQEFSFRGLESLVARPAPVRPAASA